MSRSGFLSRALTAGSFALAAAVVAAGLFPLESRAQQGDAPGITVDAGAPLAHRGALRYPQGSLATGEVQLEASLDPNGEVADAHVVSGPAELRKESLASVLQWHYLAQPAPPPTVRITITYASAPGPRAATGIEVPPLPPPPPPPPPPGAPDASLFPFTIDAIVYRNITPELQAQVENKLLVRAGDTISRENLRQITARVQEVDEHLTAGLLVSTLSEGPQRTLRISLAQATVLAQRGAPVAVAGGRGGRGGGPAGQAAATAPAAAPAGTVRVSAAVMEANRLKQVPPEYPPVARTARIQGTVLLDIVVDREGKVISAEPVSGHPTLIDAAVTAVKQWEYRPTLLNGQPVQVATQVTVTFQLQ